MKKIRVPRPPPKLKVNMSMIRDIIPTFREHLMLFFKTDICLEVLVETGCAKTVKYL